MKFRIAWFTLVITLLAGAAFAQEPQHPPIGIGFHEVDAPLGVRWWFSSGKIGLDLGLGFGSDEVANENFDHFAFDVGLPIKLKSWDRVHFIVRPAIVYRSQEVLIDPGPPVIKDSNTSMTVQGELEAEVFVVDNVSISAAQGFAITNTDFAVGGSATDWGTTGSNWTHLGFHVYLWGGK